MAKAIDKGVLIMKKYYHYTKLDSLPDILGSGILQVHNGGVYVCDSKEDLYKFISLYYNAKLFELDEIVGLEFTTDAILEESTDHNPNLLWGAKAFVSYKDIAIDVINVFNI